MVKKLGAGLLALVIVFSFTGCARDGGSWFYRGWKHFQWHILGFYQDMVNIHKDIDRYAFNLDERDPNRY